jgi:hypothetical protein
VQQISAYDPPAYTGEPVRLTFSRTLSIPSGSRRENQVWGTKDPRYIAGVLGDFPKASLIEPEWVEAAQKRSLARNRNSRWYRRGALRRFGDRDHAA